MCRSLEIIVKPAGDVTEPRIEGMILDEATVAEQASFVAYGLYTFSQPGLAMMDLSDRGNNQLKNSAQPLAVALTDRRHHVKMWGLLMGTRVPI